MNPKSYTGTRDSRSIYNEREGGASPQRKPGEKRVTTPRSLFGSTPADRPQETAKESSKEARYAVIVSRRGKLVVEYK
jgi:hypothetical protein